ncbi:alpha/beta fold hydrolase [Aldersonia kunmingensis]|uniref:alpha/beta fold hydrolase n=1 Tax=Aldersonia kunmingensis TaxID=408066 RepID=UPI000832A2A4|nr:alpha/beta hydrolase [Aldersonia kunmingensis]
MTTQTVSGIAFDDTGTGAPALLCLPGWCGDRTAFDPVRPLLAVHRRTLTIDLPDQGESPRRDVDFTSATVVDEVLDVIAQSGVDQVVPVATAHAGWVAIEMRRRLGAKRVPAIVVVDWMVLGPPPGFTDALAGLQSEASWEQVRGALFDMWTTGVDDPTVPAYVATMGHYGYEHWSRAGREIAASFAAESTPVDALEALDEPCPTLHVYAQPRDDEFLAAQQEYAAAHPWFHVQRLDARSHFPTIEAPAAVATAIEEFLCKVK